MRAIVLACVLFTPTVHAVTCTASSTPTRARLLELYTSEGCSSCPPADRWLSQIPVDSGVVPLAFHVDYWDRLGWKDPFGQAAFSQRQRARNSGPGWIYTPQVMLDGVDYRNWHLTRGPQPASEPAQVSLAMRLTRTPSDIVVQVSSRFAPGIDSQTTQLYLALFENRLSSQVAAGENAQRTLNHDYVVRELVGPLDSRMRHRFKLNAQWNAAHLGVAAFVVNQKGETLQALARAACP